MHRAVHLVQTVLFSFELGSPQKLRDGLVPLRVLPRDFRCGSVVRWRRAHTNGTTRGTGRVVRVPVSSANRPGMRPGYERGGWRASESASFQTSKESAFMNSSGG